MSPSRNTTSPHDPDRGASASRMGYFPIMGEGVVMLLFLFVAIRIFGTDRPDVFAWVLLVMAALLLADMIRRIFRAVRINRKELT